MELADWWSEIRRLILSLYRIHPSLGGKRVRGRSHQILSGKSFQAPHQNIGNIWCHALGLMLNKTSDIRDTQDVLLLLCVCVCVVRTSKVTFRVMCETDPLCACVSRKELDTGNDVVPLSVVQEGDSLRAFWIIMKSDLCHLSIWSLSDFSFPSTFNIGQNKLQWIFGSFGLFSKFNIKLGKEARKPNLRKIL